MNWTVSAFIVAAFFAASHANSAEVDDADVQRSVEALELYHIAHDLYLPVKCQDAEVDGQYFIRCYPAGADIAGNLWQVSDGPIIYALNGKALAQLDKMNGHVTDVDGNSIPVHDWRQHHKPEERPDIIRAMSELGYGG